MDTENLTNEISTPDDDEVMLPEGYKDGDTFFDEPSDDAENIFGSDDTIEGFSGEDDDDADPSAEEEAEQEPETPMTETVAEDPETEAGEDTGTEALQQPAPAQVETKSDPAQDQELNSLRSELQRLRSIMAGFDTVSKNMGFENAQAMFGSAEETYRDTEVKRLVSEGMHEEAAKDLVERRMREVKASAQAQQTTQETQQQEQPAAQRDFKREMSELLTDRPQLRDELKNGGTLPREVIADAIKRNISLRAAYAEHELKEVRAEAERVKQENQILKQNAAAKAKAPVKGTAGGGHIETKGKDPFLQGLLSDD